MIPGMGRVKAAPTTMATFAAALLVLGIAAAASAQTTPPDPPAPSTIEFLPRYDFHLELQAIWYDLAKQNRPVQAAINYFDVTKTVTGYGTAYCGSGWKVTGGGAYQLPSDYYSSYSSTEYSLTGSWPTSSSSCKATGTKVQGSYSSSSGWRFTKYSYSPKVYAVCTSTWAHCTTLAMSTHSTFE